MKQKLLSKVMLLLFALVAGSTSVWAQSTATLQITSGVTSTGNLTDNSSNIWAFTTDGDLTSNNSYIQAGTNQKTVSYIRLTTTAFSTKKITKVQVWGTSKANTNVSAKVIIGSTTIGTSSVYTSQNASNGGTEFSVDNTNEVTGDLTIEISRASSAKGAIYFNKAIVTYVDASSSAVATTTTIDVTGITNKDVYSSTAAGSLSASVKDNNNATISGATVTWTSSDTDVATIATDGTVTLVAAGTTTITASYAGVTNQYQSSSATYELTVTDSTPFAGGDVTFTGGTDVGSTSGNNSADEISKSGVTISSTDAAFATAQYRLYSGSTTTFSTSTGTITKIVFTKNGSYDLSNLSTATGSYDSSTGTWTGNATSVSFSAAAQVRLDKIVVTVTPDGTVSAPSITGTTPFLNSTTVTITAEDGADIYYTTDGSTPSTSSTHYSAPFTIYATTTVKAIAVKDNTNSDTAEQTFTKVTPINVATALNTADNTEVYVEGIVTRVTGISSNSLTYFISDDGTESNELEIYKGKGLNGANFNSTSDLQAGDIVVVHGTLATFSSQKELSTGSTILSLTTKAAPELAYATTEYTVAPSASFETPTLTNPHNLNVTYSISDNDGVASINTSTGAVTIGANEGQVTVTASFAGDATYRAGSASYTITVVDNTKGTIDNPYSVAAIEGQTSATMYGNNIYVTGYIVGSVSNNKCYKTTTSSLVNTNLLIADTPDVSFEEGANVGSNNDGLIPVELPNTGTIRADWGVSTNNSLIGYKIIFKGNAQAYFSTNAIKGTSEITAVSAPVAVSAAGYATFSSTNALDFTNETSVYAYKASVDGENISFTRVNKVPANTGLLLRRVANEGTVNVNVPVFDGTGADDVSGNLFVAVSTEIASLASGANNCTNYILNNGSEGIGFYLANDKKVGAGKAYLAVPNNAGVRGFIGFDFSDPTTGIAVVKGELQQTEGAYDLQGRRVSELKNGLYIVNGKKVLLH